MPTARELGIDNVQGVLEKQFQLQGTIRNGEFVTNCINPGHDDNNPSFSVNLRTGLFHCFSCNFSGDLAKLAQTVLGISLDEAKKALSPNTPQALLNSIRYKEMEARPVKVKSKVASEFPSYYQDGPLDYMINRGFKEETLRRWGVQFVPSEILKKRDKSIHITNCIGIPLYSHRGILHGWIYRKTDNSEPRYVYTPEIPIGDIWFGADRSSYPSYQKGPIIVEGSLDVMWLDQAGLWAYGMLGSNADRKVGFLWQYAVIYLFPDRDGAGRDWMFKLAQQLGKYSNIYIMRYPKGSTYKDPQDCPEEVIHKMYERAIHWTVLNQNLQLSRGYGRVKVTNR